MSAAHTKTKKGKAIQAASRAKMGMWWEKRVDGGKKLASARRESWRRYMAKYNAANGQYYAGRRSARLRASKGMGRDFQKAKGIPREQLRLSGWLPGSRPNKLLNAEKEPTLPEWMSECMKWQNFDGEKAEQVEVATIAEYPTGSGSYGA